MALTFALRGDSITARYADGSPIGVVTAATVVPTADATVLGGSYIDLMAASGKCLFYDGFKNCGESRAFSVHMRIKAAYTGAPAANYVFWQLGLGRGGLGPYLSLWHSITTGNITVHGKNELSTLTFNSVSFGAWSPTADTEYDVVFSWTGVAGAGTAILTIDGVQLGTATAAASLASSWKSNYFDPINLAAAQDVTTGRLKVVEMTIWNTVIDPTAVALVGGTGSLNGESRTAFVACNQVDGSSYTDPGIANVKNGTAYTQAGVSLTGTLVSTDPGEANVKTGTSYTIESVAKTGTLPTGGGGSTRFSF